MESSMGIVSSSELNIKLIKEFFKKNFSLFKILKESFNGPFWHVSIMYKDEIKIIIEGDAGFGIMIEMDNESFDLWSYNRKVNNYSKTSKSNILYQLEVLKDFLE